MSGFLGKTLSEISRYIRDSVYSERYAGKRGLLQSIDPRVKLIAILGFITVTVFVHSISALLILMLISVLLAMLSSIPLRFYIPRVWLFIPIFTGVIAIPAMFNVVSPGKEIFTLISWNGVHLYITQEGLWSASILVLRVATAVSFAVLLTLTTRWNELINSLLALRISSVFVMVLTFTYRYIFYLLDIMSKMILSRKARSSGRLGARRNWKLFAPLIGALFIRAYETNNRVYLAMLSRGFSGEARKGEHGYPHTIALTFLSVSIVIYILIIMGEHIRVIP